MMGISGPLPQPEPTSAGEPGAAAAAMLDTRTLDRLAEDLGGVESVREIATLFLDSLPARWAEVSATWQSGDAPAATRAAHTLKSAAAIVGLNALSDLCRQLELLARENRLAEGARALTEGADTCRSADRELKGWLEKL